MNDNIEDLLNQYAFSMVRSEVLRTMGSGSSLGYNAFGDHEPPQLLEEKAALSPQIVPISSPHLERERNERQQLASVLEQRGHPVHTHRLKSRASWATTEILPYCTTLNASWFIEGIFIVVEVRSGLVEAYTETLKRITNAPVIVEKMAHFHVAGMESSEMAKAWIEGHRDKLGKFSLKGAQKIDIYLDHITGPSESGPKH